MFKRLITLCLALALMGCSTVTDSVGLARETTETTTEAPIETTAEPIDLIAEAKLRFPQLTPIDESKDTLIVLHTTKGDIKAKLFPKYAPKATENFLGLIEKGYYTDTIFHRVINNFMIQGGDPTGLGIGGASIWGNDFENEISLKMRHFRGALCMANSGPDTNGSQFYIVQNADKELLSNMFNSLDYTAPYTVGDEEFTDDTGEAYTYGDIFPEALRELYLDIGGYPTLDMGYTVFGQVYKGMEVVDTIAATPTDDNDKPLEPITIIGAEILNDPQEEQTSNDK